MRSLHRLFIIKPEAITHQLQKHEAKKIATFICSHHILTLSDSEKVTKIADSGLHGRRLKTVNLTQH